MTVVYNVLHIFYVKLTKRLNATCSPSFLYSIMFFWFDVVYYKYNSFNPLLTITMAPI